MVNQGGIKCGWTDRWMDRQMDWQMCCIGDRPFRVAVQLAWKRQQSEWYRSSAVSEDCGDGWMDGWGWMDTNGPVCGWRGPIWGLIVAKALDGQRYPCPALVGCGWSWGGSRAAAPKGKHVTRKTSAGSIKYSVSMAIGFVIRKSFSICFHKSKKKCASIFF